MVILPIGSGKGGVGKSLLAVNLAIAMAEAGRKVALADLDLGASNLHTMLGVRPTGQGIGTFLSVPRMHFSDIVLRTEYEGLSFIPGDAEIPGIANLKSAQRQRLVRQLTSLEFDYLVLDLGPGTGASTLDFFLLAGSGILITTPTLTAILNAYLFLKNAVFRLMYGAIEKTSRAWSILEELRREASALQKAYVPRILERIGAEDRASRRRIDALLLRFRPRLVLNMLEDPRDAEKTERLLRSTREYLGVELEQVGMIYRDDLQDIALGSRLPIIRYKPRSILSLAVYRIAERILEAKAEGSLVDAEKIGEEAETDFQLKRRDIEDLLHAGALSTGDLVETVRSQLFELAALRRENQLLKDKLRKAIQDGFSL